MDQITAVCPGSFDPVTVGHLDIIRRAANMFAHVIVVVATNSSKRPSFTAEERMEMIKTATADIPNVTVAQYGGLLADYAKEVGARAIVKGLRAMSDFEYEFQMALTNKKLNPDVETVFLTTQAENMYLSSSMVKEIARMGGDISDFVPEVIHDTIIKRIQTERK
ncbi:MAG: pantetheine-phosphate adenylyltransferase [Clostridia bacterium]|nr:pantetheine-phosphate adenylyltransferase [Clostridia bacterium]